MKEKILVLTIIATMGVISASLTGCDRQGLDLEGIFEKNSVVKEKIDKSVASMENEDMDISVDFNGNDILITGALKKTYTDAEKEELKQRLGDEDSELGKAFLKATDQIREVSELPGVSSKIIITNGDGGTLWEKEYK